MKQYAVSVIIPTYNCGRYLAGCIESVLAQTWHDFELIIVNDGSTDNTEDVIQPFLKDPRVLYIKQKNGGHGNARNTAMKRAKGDYIAFLDADDLWDPTKLEKQLNLFTAPTIGLVYCRWRFLDEKGRIIKYCPESKYFEFRSGGVTEYLFFDNFMATPSIVIRKDCLERSGLFDESIMIGEDWDLWLRISVNYEVRYVDEPLITVRIDRPGKISTNVELRHECTDRIRNMFQEKYPTALTPQIVRKALAYSYCQRGYYYRGKSFGKALFFYFSSIKVCPQSYGAWNGLMKMVPFFIFHKFKRLRQKVMQL